MYVHLLHQIGLFKWLANIILPQKKSNNLYNKSKQNAAHKVVITYSYLHSTCHAFVPKCALCVCCHCNNWKKWTAGVAGRIPAVLLLQTANHSCRRDTIHHLKHIHKLTCNTPTTTKNHNLSHKMNDAIKSHKHAHMHQIDNYSIFYSTLN